MNDYLPIVFFIALFLIVRARREKSLRLLSTEQRERLFRDFTRYHAAGYAAIVLAILPPLLVLNGTLADIPASVGLACGGVLVALLLTLGHRIFGEKLRALKMPDEFVRAYLGLRLWWAALLGFLYYRAVVAVLPSAGFARIFF